MNVYEIQRNCYDVIDERLPWDFYEDGDDVVSYVLSSTTPGRLVNSLLSDTCGRRDQRRIVNLFIAYAARMSLVCWFEYCDDMTPFNIIESVVGSLIQDAKIDYDLNAHYLNPCVPAENGIPIVDCRESDTLSASLSVAHAAVYNCGGGDEHAAYSLSYSFGAISVSPVWLSGSFVDWLLKKALPSSLDLTLMPLDSLLLEQMRARNLI